MEPYTILLLVRERPDIASLALAVDLLGTQPGQILVPMRHDGPWVERALSTTGELENLIAGRIQAGTHVVWLERCSDDLGEALRSALLKGRPDLVLLPVGAEGVAPSGLQAMMEAAECDLAVARVGTSGEVESILLPALGGPADELALELGQRIATRRAAQLTLLHLDAPSAGAGQRERRQRSFHALLARSCYPRLRSSTIPAPEPARAIVAEAGRHQMTIIGAGDDREDGGPLLGSIARAVLQSAPGSVLVVRPGQWSGRHAEASQATGHHPEAEGS